MLLAQPLHGPAYPQTAKAQGALVVGTLVEGAIAGEHSAWSKNSGHLPKRCAFIGDEVDRVTEEHRIHIVDECGKIDCFSLEEIGFSPQHFEVFLPGPRRASSRAYGGNVCLSSLAAPFFGHPPRDRSP